MQLRHLRTILPYQDGAAKVTAIAWSPNSLKLAVSTVDRVVILFDDTGEKRDKFSTKPADSAYGKKNYVVKGLAFSSDSTKLAVGQTDNIVFVYKIGDDWGDKKVICNKFVQQSAVTCLAWPVQGNLVIGLADGKVRVAHLKTNKSNTLYVTDSCVETLAVNQKGTGIISGHTDGTIVRFYVTNDGASQPQGKVTVHSVAPCALAWTANHIIAAGCDKKISVYSPEGRQMQQLDFSRLEDEHEFTTAVVSPDGQSVAIGSFSRIRIFTYSVSKRLWEEQIVKEIPSLYTVTALSWSPDGLHITCGNLCGGVETFECVLKRSIWNGRLEIVHISASQVIIKNKTGGSGMVLRTKPGLEIFQVRIMGGDRYAVARTAHSLLVADLENSACSEVPWENENLRMNGEQKSREKFYFDNTNVCMIFMNGELTLIEYGVDKILDRIRMEYMNPHLISVRINDRRWRGSEEVKMLAFLLDLKTICISDLITGRVMGQIGHDSKIDWLELNETGKKLLFRDQRARLFLMDVHNSTKVSLLGSCSFVQWVPGSDVIVAQNTIHLCVWYNVESPEQVTLVDIRGDVIDLVRTAGKTEVRIQDGDFITDVALDDQLIEFGTAIEDGDLLRALNYLENLEGTVEARALWQSLAQLAWQNQELRIAERCYAAIGDVAKTRYIRDTINMAEDLTSKTGGDGMKMPSTWARLSICNNDLKAAERIYVEQGQVEDALQMYKVLHKWEDAMRLQSTYGINDARDMKEEYLRWLQETFQDDKAADLKIREGNVQAALALYLKAGLPCKAAKLVMETEDLLHNTDVVQRVIGALTRSGFMEQAGDVYHRLGQPEQALDCYKKGHVYVRALELARQAFPGEVIALEEAWGDHLHSIKQSEAAIGHYIEAGKTKKALEAAVQARQWEKAAEILPVLGDDMLMPNYCQTLGQHFASVGKYERAESFFLKANMFKEAIAMHNKAGQWKKAFDLGKKYLTPAEVKLMFLDQGRKLEEQGKLKEAEKVFVTIGETDMAVTMYRKHQQYDQLVKLVSEQKPETLTAVHKDLAKQLEQEKNFRAAEHHFLQSGDWKSAVNMHRVNGNWEEAYRVARSKGGDQASKQVAFLWAQTLGGELGAKLLTRYGILKECIDYSCDTGQFEFAYELARLGAMDKLPDIHYRKALNLEERGQFQEAEEAFIAAGKTREAVHMYLHENDWVSATRVAEAHDREALPEVLVSQAKAAFDAKDFPLFEALLLRIQKPDFVIKGYKEAGLWSDAFRICKEYLPHKLSSLQDEYDRTSASSSRRVDAASAGGLLMQARRWEEEGEYARAIDCYFKVTPNVAGDLAKLANIWIKATELALKFLDEEKAYGYVHTAATQMKEWKKHSVAAQLFLSVDAVQDAVEALIEGEEWSKARKIAQELEPSLESRVESAYKVWLKQSGQAEQLAEVDLGSGLDLLAKQGDWQKCLEKAKAHGPALLQKYAALYATHLIKEKKSDVALKVFLQYGAPANPQNYNIYRHFAEELLHNPKSAPNDFPNWSALRTILLQVTAEMEKSAKGSAEYEEFVRLLWISHLYSIRLACIDQKDLSDTRAKISVSLLRYADVIPADKAFYEAGMASKEAGKEALAFVLLNRFLDLADAIEDGSGIDALDNTDFAETDIPFDTLYLPKQPMVSERDREDAKEWVLAISLDQRIEQTLPLDERGVYEACLKGGSNHALPCAVTGYPVLRDSVVFQNSEIVANRKDWNALLLAVKGQPDSDIQDVVDFIKEWGGGLASSSFQYGF